MPHISPHARAMRFLRWLEKDIPEGFRYSDNPDVVDRLAEVIADAQDEVREGFLRKPRGREQTIHD